MPDQKWDIIVYTPPLYSTSPAVSAIRTVITVDKAPLVKIALLCPIPTKQTAPSCGVPWPLSVAMINVAVQPCPKKWDIIVYVPPRFLTSPAVAAIRTDLEVIEDEAPLVEIVPLYPIPTKWTAPSCGVPWPLSVAMINKEEQPCPKKWDIIVYVPPRFLTSPAVAAIRTDLEVIEDEAPLVEIVPIYPIPTKWMAPSCGVPWPLSVAMIDEEEQPCPKKWDIIVYVPPTCLHVAPPQLSPAVAAIRTEVVVDEAPLSQEVICKDTTITNAAVCVLTDAPSSGETSPASSSGGAADALQLDLCLESQMDVDIPFMASHFYSSQCVCAPVRRGVASRIEVRPEFSCASVEGCCDQAGAHASGDSSGYIYQSDESIDDDLHTTSSCSEDGECAPSASCSGASTTSRSHAQWIKMRPEYRLRTFAEVVSGCIATHLAVTVVDPTTSAHTFTARPRTWAEVVKAVPATLVAA
jgi:hypothetical protein